MRNNINRYAIIAVLSIIMGLMMSYLAGTEEPSFGKDFLTFYTFVFGAIASVFITLMVIEYKENMLNVGLFLLAITFNPITILLLVLIGASGCSKPEQNTIVWRVAYINTDLKLQDYVHNTSENGCKCRHQPYAFGSDFYEMPYSLKDSTMAIDKFYDFKDKESYIVYEAYPYCKKEDWVPVENWEDRKMLTVRSAEVDALTICQKFGLIDNAGHYIK